MAIMSAASIHSVDARGIREGIKKGFTKSDFCMRYGCEEGDLMSWLAQLFSKNDKDLRKVISQIEANEKKSRKTKSKQPKVTPVIVVEAQEETEEPVNELDRLRSEETANSDAVMALESEHKKLVSDHRACADKLRAIDKNIDKIRSQLDKSVNEFKQVVEEAERIEAEMERVNAERRVKGAKLDEIRKKIEDLSRVTVVVYNNGEFEIAEGKIELDDTGYDELYSQIRDDEQYETLRIIDIKTLAKAVCYKRNSAVKIEFMFDSKDIEEIFLRIA